MIPEEARIAYNAKMVEILNYFISFCESQSLTYWVGYGTAIGAVRHHSIIPWDDDIDLLMPRKSYNDLLNYSDIFNNGKFELLHVLNRPDSTCRVIHICDTQTTVITKIKLPIVNGVHIGISPIDFSDDSEEEIIKHSLELNKAFGSYFNCLYHYTFFDLINSFKHPRKAFSIFKNWYYQGSSKERFRKQALEYDNYYAGSIGKRAFNMHELLFSKKLHCFNSEWFNDSVQFPFEGIQVNLPIGYHNYLTAQYGDYMTPPPADCQVPHHSIDYLNLNKRLSFSQALERYNRGNQYEL